MSKSMFEKIKDVLSRHKTRLDKLEERISILESDPWKMPL
jgi:BMFP domain-containing protein YqiC